MNRKKYFKIGLGGTFDHFHAGHAKFIDFAAELGAHLVIGVTDPHLTKHKPFAELIEPYSTRVQAVHHYCNTRHIAHNVVRLTDVFGPTLENNSIKALCVTPETSRGADKINEVREKLQLSALPVYICDYFLAQNGQPLHAESIRSGQLNRHGIVYSQAFKEDLALTPVQRQFFQQLQGLVIDEPSDSLTESRRIVVGDVSLQTFITQGWRYDLGIFDRLEQRQASFLTTSISPDATTANQAGNISLQLIKAIQSAWKSKQKHLLVKGEEDLSAVAAALLTPLTTQIYYGQPGEGLVEMVVTEELKDKFYQTLTKPNLSQT